VTADLQHSLQISLPATHMALSRLARTGHIVSPYRGFYVVVAPELRVYGVTPANDFIDALMGWLGEPYYLSLLTSAAMYGAAHQAPLRTQVIVRRARRTILCGRVAIDFLVRADMEKTATQILNTRGGVIRVASPETTALELVGYAQRCAGLDHVATVLAELGEAMDGAALAGVAAGCPIAWVQRLGWLLELVQQWPLADRLFLEQRSRISKPTRLAPWLPGKGAPRQNRWRLIVNVHVEPDDV
jgi:predicted transcriptional regulator of viral defense system